MARWLIAAAVDLEIRILRAQLAAAVPERMEKGRAWSGTWKGRPVLLVTTGIGPERARRTLGPLLREGGLEGVCSVGYAGGLLEEIKVGDLLVPEEILVSSVPQERRFRPDAALYRRALRTALQRGWACHTGRMVTVDHVVASEREKRDLGEVWRAASVEMESGVVAELAAEAAVPFLTVRVALDTVGFCLPDVSGFLRFWKQKQWKELAAHGAGQPGQLLALARVMWYCRIGSIRLARFLADFFATPFGAHGHGEDPASGPPAA
ncbi:MAG: hypothetical protein AB1640_08300 [bacterium]